MLSCWSETQSYGIRTWSSRARLVEQFLSGCLLYRSDHFVSLFDARSGLHEIRIESLPSETSAASTRPDKCLRLGPSGISGVSSLPQNPARPLIGAFNFALRDSWCVYWNLPRASVISTSGPCRTRLRHSQVCVTRIPFIHVYSLGSESIRRGQELVQDSSSHQALLWNYQKYRHFESTGWKLGQLGQPHFQVTLKSILIYIVFWFLRVSIFKSQTLASIKSRGYIQLDVYQKNIFYRFFITKMHKEFLLPLKTGIEVADFRLESLGRLRFVYLCLSKFVFLNVFFQFFFIYRWKGFFMYLCYEKYGMQQAVEIALPSRVMCRVG